MNRTKKCIQCKKIFNCPRKMGIGVWTKRKYCSKKCKDLSPQPKGESAHAWKVEGIGYSGVHRWLYRECGLPSQCKHCGTTESKRFEWANISGEYKRDITDFIRLCAKCHDKYDEPWKKRTRDFRGRFI